MITRDPAAGSKGRARGNLPAEMSSFIGREREAAEVARLLAGARLLTLTGAGGAGKTRLALHVARQVAEGHPDGVWLVELAASTDPSIVPQAVALGLQLERGPPAVPRDALAEHLRPRSLLLILDNCEHLVEAVADLVSDLLRACPDLRVLATSREALGLPGETVWRVPSLSLPPAGPLRAEEAMASESVQLFVDRAAAAKPGFRLSEDNARAVAEICSRLDGIPLAIELAAARVRAFSPAQIAARLDDRFLLLSGTQRGVLPRQQTLEAAVDWSYRLLSEPERALLRRLSVFAAGWTLEAAETVAAGGGIEAYAVLDLLGQLVDKSLVQAEERRGAARYGLLETIRQYAADRLRDAGEEAETRDRHLDYLLRLAEEAEPKLQTPEEGVFLQQLEDEHDNLRAALRWGLARPAEDAAALRLGGALAWFWFIRGYSEEGCRWLDQALAKPGSPPAARLKALYGAGWLAHHARDPARAREHLEEALALARVLEDRWAEAWSLHVLGRVAYFENDPAGARALANQSLALAEAVGDPWLVAWPLHLLGLAAYLEADYAEAEARFARSMAIREEIGYEQGIAILLVLRSLTALRDGDLLRAADLCSRALAVFPSMGGAWASRMPLATMAYIAAEWGQAALAARLGAAASASGGAGAAPMIPIFESVLTEALETAKQELGETGYEQAAAAGRAMSLEEAIAEALALQLPDPTMTTAARAPRRGTSRLGLTAAEVEVLHRLAAGRTTREIAEELVVAVSTVERHLTHIYQKLGVRNRAEAVRTALERGLAP